MNVAQVAGNHGIDHADQTIRCKCGLKVWRGIIGINKRLALDCTVVLMSYLVNMSSDVM